MAAVELKSIEKDFKGTKVLHGINLSVASGEFVSLLGPSGCGKTTLLRCVAGLETPTSGTVQIAGEDVTSLPPERRRLSMMFQSYALFPHMSVLENTRFGLRMLGRGSKSRQHELAQAALERVHLGHLGHRMPAQLSGGQQQRVALARAIATEPRVLLLDEPLSNLDARLREEMQVELQELHRALGLTTIFVTHDQQEAMSLSDRIVLLNSGRVEQEGAPDEIYARPGSAFAADFIGAANLLEAVRHDDHATLDVADVRIPLEGQGGDGPGKVMLRQEDLTLAEAPDAEHSIEVRVVARINRGADSVYVVTLHGQQLRVVASKHLEDRSGGTVWLGWRAGAPRWLPA